jgi:hypothetical protein
MCLVKEDWTFFNILRVYTNTILVEGGNAKFLQFSNKEIPGSTSHTVHFVRKNLLLTLTAYRATLSKCVSKTFGYLGTVPYTR